MEKHSDYIVYVDESGDHSIGTIDKTYPMFVLAFCIFSKQEYTASVTPRLQRLKFDWFGHDTVLLHEHDIRKARGAFSFLVDATKRQRFIGDLTQLMSDTNFTLIATAIKKDKLKGRYVRPQNPYFLGMKFCLERLCRFLDARHQLEGMHTHIVAEMRGKSEDSQLELEFRRICDGDNYRSERLPFSLVLADKKINSCGLQIADLVARPIGRHTLNPKQENRAFEILERKFDRNEKGRYLGCGLKEFP